MSSLLSAIVQTIRSYIEEYLNVPASLPLNERIIIFWALILIGVAFAFAGKKAFRWILLVAGAAIGWYSSFYFAQFITSFVSLPTILINVIGALIGAAFLFFLARFSICAGIALLAYYVAFSILGISSGYLLLVILVTFILAEFFYKKILAYVTPILGGLLVYYSTFGLGFGALIAIGLGALLAVLGILTHIVLKD